MQVHQVSHLGGGDDKSFSTVGVFTFGTGSFHISRELFFSFFVCFFLVLINDTDCAISSVSKVMEQSGRFVCFCCKRRTFEFDIER